MKKTITLIAVMLLSAAYCFSQGTAINATGSKADSSAILDLSSTSKGLRIPRVGLTDTSSAVTPVNNPAHGLLVFDTLTGPAGSGISPGFYYWDATKTQWIQLASTSSSSSGSSSGTDFQFHQVLFLSASSDNPGAQWTVPAGYVWKIEMFGTGSGSGDVAGMYLYTNGSVAYDYRGGYFNSGYLGPRSKYSNRQGEMWLPEGTTIGTVCNTPTDFRWLSVTEYKILP